MAVAVISPDFHSGDRGFESRWGYGVCLGSARLTREAGLEQPSSHKES